MENIQNSHKFTHELTVLVDVHKTLMSCIQENPNFYKSKKKTKRERKE